MGGGAAQGPGGWESGDGEGSVGISQAWEALSWCQRELKDWFERELKDWFASKPPFLRPPQPCAAYLVLQRGAEEHHSPGPPALEGRHGRRGEEIEHVHVPAPFLLETKAIYHCYYQ